MYISRLQAAFDSWLDGIRVEKVKSALVRWDLKVWSPSLIHHGYSSHISLLCSTEGSIVASSERRGGVFYAIFSLQPAHSLHVQVLFIITVNTYLFVDNAEYARKEKK